MYWVIESLFNVDSISSKYSVNPSMSSILLSIRQKATLLKVVT